MITRVALGTLVATLATTASAAWQEVSPTFGCANGAVILELNDAPPLHFERETSLPALNGKVTKQFSFAFQKGAFRSIRMVVASTMPDQGWGRGTVALFDVYAETTPAVAAPPRYWHLVQLESNRDSELSLAYTGPDSPEVGFGTEDAELPLLHVRYLQDLGGANADNWEEQHLILDFRAEEPKAFATASCAYNTGGGACTAYDGAYTTRASAVSCSWQAARERYRCEWRDNDARGWGTRSRDRVAELGGARKSDSDVRWPWPVE